MNIGKPPHILKSKKLYDCILIDAPCTASGLIQKKPEILIKDSEDIKNAVNDIMNAFLNINHIFNLGHGVIKTTPVDNIELLIDTVKNWKK